MFKKAERKRIFVKMALCGVSGSGKTYSALLLAQGLGGKIAMIDTENGSVNFTLIYAIMMRPNLNRHFRQ